MSSARHNKAALRDWQLRTLARCGIELPPNCKVLDFGCGEGGLVEAYKGANYDAYGCDLREALGTGPELDAIADPYRLPYEDATFDLVVSNEVFEHVHNPREAFAEIARVLKRDGVSLHRFPPRYVPIEPHTYVPLATLIHAQPWLRLWALIGIRKESQRGLGSAETAESNARYLRERTNYAPRRSIIRDAHPLRARFVEREAIQASETRLQILTPIAGVVGRVYGGLRSRVLLLQRDHRRYVARSMPNSASR